MLIRGVGLFCLIMDNLIETPKEYNPADHLLPHRFTSTNQPAKRGRHKGSSPTDYLKKLSRTKINFHNPITNKDEIGEVNLVVAIQLILKATQDSDLPSIREYFDRLDGKTPQKLIGEGFGGDTKIIFIYPPNWKPKDERIADTTEKLSS